MKSREDLILESIEIEKLALKFKKALYELVELKAMKDSDGFKSVEYQKRQPIAWEAAREALGL